MRLSSISGFHTAAASHLITAGETKHSQLSPEAATILAIEAVGYLNVSSDLLDFINATVKRDTLNELASSGIPFHGVFLENYESVRNETSANSSPRGLTDSTQSSEGASSLTSSVEGNPSYSPNRA